MLNEENLNGSLNESQSLEEDDLRDRGSAELQRTLIRIFGVLAGTEDVRSREENAVRIINILVERGHINYSARTGSQIGTILDFLVYCDTQGGVRHNNPRLLHLEGVIRENGGLASEELGMFSNLGLSALNNDLIGEIVQAAESGREEVVGGLLNRAQDSRNQGLLRQMLVNAFASAAGSGRRRMIGYLLGKVSEMVGGLGNEEELLRQMLVSASVSAARSNRREMFDDLLNIVNRLGNEDGLRRQVLVSASVSAAASNHREMFDDMVNRLGNEDGLLHRIVVEVLPQAARSGYMQMVEYLYGRVEVQPERLQETLAQALESAAEGNHREVIDYLLVRVQELGEQERILRVFNVAFPQDTRSDRSRIRMIRRVRNGVERLEDQELLRLFNETFPDQPEQAIPLGQGRKTVSIPLQMARNLVSISSGSDDSFSVDSDSDDVPGVDSSGVEQPQMVRAARKSAYSPSSSVEQPLARMSISLEDVTDRQRNSRQRHGSSTSRVERLLDQASISSNDGTGQQNSQLEGSSRRITRSVTRSQAQNDEGSSRRVTRSVTRSRAQNDGSDAAEQGQNSQHLTRSRRGHSRGG